MNESGGLGYEYQDDTLPYRCLLCDVIQQAFINAQGRELSVDSSGSKKFKRVAQNIKNNAVEFIESDDFEYYLELLDIDFALDGIRRLVRMGNTYNISLFRSGKFAPKLIAEQRETIRERYAQGETKAQLAREFGIHPTSVRDLVTA